MFDDNDTISVPSLCNFCGKFFNGGHRVGKGVLSLRDRHNFCPSCGREAEIKVDLVPFLESTIEAAKKLSLEKILELERKLKDLHHKNMEESEVEQVGRVLEEALPESISLKSLMPKTRSEAYTVVGLIIAAVGLLISLLGSGETVNNTYIINEIVPQAPVPTAPALFSPVAPSPSTKKPGRNDPCPCDSGKKFKRCHGVDR